MRDPQALANQIQVWRENPRAFAYEELHFEAGDPWQDEVLRVFPSQDPDKLRISMQACTGPGKTAIEAVCNLNFISCYGTKTEHPQGLCTSITEDNLNANLWKELAVWQARSEYLRAAFKWTATRFSSVDHPETWFLEARTWSKRADPETMGRALSGLHAPFVMVTLDESGDMPVPILRSGEQIFSSRYRWAKLLQGGNPTSLDGALHHAASIARHLWYIVRVSGDPDDPYCAKRVNRENNREQIAMYGRENPWVKATILGLFPPASINALLGVDDVELAMKRHLRDEDYSWAQKRLGVDVARYGGDRTVFFPRQGLAAFRPRIERWPLNSAVSVQIANAAMAYHTRWGCEQTFMDSTGGWAAGARDIMVSQGYAPIDVDFSSTDTNDRRYYNCRSEIHFTAAQWVQGGGALPPIPELVAEATATTYTFYKGKMLVEDKDQVKKKLGRSPDLWDAFVTTFRLVEMPSAAAAAGIRGGQPQVKSDWDPYAEDRT
jgi:phage terminase large subunit